VLGVTSEGKRGASSPSPLSSSQTYRETETETRMKKGGEEGDLVFVLHP